jgi:hypothetical protein
MFFKRKKKSEEQIAREQKVMRIHETASYMTYIDEYEIRDGKLYFEGPHNRGRLEENMTVLILDCNGEQLGILLIEEGDVKRQKRLQGSVQTGEYVYLSGKLLSGKEEDMNRASMLVNEFIILK